jgi:hypothetical protein
MLAFAGTASGFGTVDVVINLKRLGFKTRQTAVHWKLTRAALECAAQPRRQLADDPGRCFEPESMERLSGEGRRARIGAVEAADFEGFFEDAPHCQNGDYIPGVRYPRGPGGRINAVQACRRLVLRRFAQAVTAADELVDAQGLVIANAVDISMCQFVDRGTGLAGAAGFEKQLERVEDELSLRESLYASIVLRLIRGDIDDHGGTPGPTAKCHVLRHLGAVLHAIQDSYAHGNWTDFRGPGPVSVENPPGLGRNTLNPWVRPRGGGRLDRGWLTACYGLLGECEGRVNHDEFAKDNGRVRLISQPVARSALSIGDAIEPRGQVAGSANFVRAVSVARHATADAWNSLGVELIETYGENRGRQMICAITHDEPVVDCVPSGGTVVMPPPPPPATSPPPPVPTGSCSLQYFGAALDEVVYRCSFGEEVNRFGFELPAGVPMVTGQLPPAGFTCGNSATSPIDGVPLYVCDGTLPAGVEVTGNVRIPAPWPDESGCGGGVWARPPGATLQRVGACTGP